jgi:hypothetical protein
MKAILLVLTALLLTPLALFAQDKPDVANATLAAKGAWDSAPAQSKALWLLQRVFDAASWSRGE